MARRRRRRKLQGPLIALLLVGAGVSGYYTVFIKPIRDAGPPPTAKSEPGPVAGHSPAASRAGRLLAAESPGNATLPTDASTTLPSTTQPTMGLAAAPALLKTGMESLSRGDLVDARTRLSEALEAGLSEADATGARSQLAKLAEQTIFGPAITPNDPHVIAHVVQAGDTLAKIAKDHGITSDLLARINGIADKNRIREGQRMKVIRGPFTAVVNRRTFDMDVFLGRTVVKHFRVGLGTDGSTPAGTWKVHNKLVNPTYYPPRGGAIIAADDPKNPLGERWIGLVGTEGEAVGQERYGVHGTIEPESIGKNMSLGCVRMLNPDVEMLFEMLVEGQSTVAIR